MIKTKGRCKKKGITDIFLFGHLSKKTLRHHSIILVMLGIFISLLLISQYSSFRAYAAVNIDSTLMALNESITAQQDTKMPITLLANGAAKFWPTELPVNGTLTPFNSQHLTYTPNPGFHGTDRFTFLASNSAGMTSNIATVKITVSWVPKPIIYPTDPQARIAISFVISAIIVILVIIAAWIILRRKKKSKNIKQYSRLSDIIRTEDWDPSLSIFQFLLWTIVVLFAFFAVYLIRIFGGVSTPPQGGVPIYLLALMGISVGVPIASNIVSSVKYSSPMLSTVRPPEEELPPYSDMLKEYGKPTLSRFQMFGWTWIGIGVYLFVFFSKTMESMILVQNLILPDIDPTLVILMGLSQTAFLGGKTAASRTEITQVVPPEGQIGMPVQIFGSNFGSNQDTIWFGDIQIRGNDIKTWTSDRIDIVVPMQVTEAKPYPVRVAVGGFLTDGKPFKVTKITTESPRIFNTSPSDGSSGVSISAEVSASSDHPLDGSTVNSNSFTLKSSVDNKPIEEVSVSLSSDRKTAKLQLNSPKKLQPSTLYVATVTTAIKDIEGNAMSESKIWSFTTGLYS
jgi:hypothetical protein